jgi:2'-5' RNA ligase
VSVFRGGDPPTALLVPGPPSLVSPPRLVRRLVKGIPPHITLLFPFLSTRQIEGETLAALAEVFRLQEPFEYSFTGIGRFPEERVLYLAPEPVGPFVALTRAISSRFPEQQPYGGAYPDIVPHMTVRTGPEPPGLAEHLTQTLPVGGLVSEVWLMSLSRWRPRLLSRFPLGPRP